MVTNDDVKNALSRLYNLHNTDVDLGLDRVRNLLAKLDNPHLKTPPVIHIAGTNGKGSTLTFIRSILNAAGYSCHAYISPNLVNFQERIRLADTLISNEKLVEYISYIEEVNAGEPITFFEITTVLAFYAFAQNNADVLLLEVGLGGRLDATNVVENPALSVITSIGMDHMNFLGDTIEEIAVEKAGIVKNNAPVIIAPQKYSSAVTAIEEIASKRRAEIMSLIDDNFDFEITMKGVHQRDNARTAISAVKALSFMFEVNEDHIKQGLKDAFWAGRFQKLNPEGAFSKKAPHLVEEIYVDGGHNLDAIHAQVSVIEELKKSGKKLSTIIAIKEDKDYFSYLKAIEPYCDQIIFVPLNNQMKGVEPSLMREVIPSAQIASGLEEAFPLINYDLCLITGSLFLVGEALALNGEEIS